MASCRRHQCIYIADCVNNVVHRVEVQKNQTIQWSLNDQPSGLSLNSLSNILVTFRLASKLKEFTTDGKLMRGISLPLDIMNPNHAVQLNNDQFVVCHGWPGDNLHSMYSR